MELMELIQKRANLVDEARRIVDRIDQEKRPWSQEEKNQYDKIMNDVNELGEEITRRQRLRELQDQLSQPLNAPIRPEPGTMGRKANPRDSKEYIEAFNAYLSGGPALLTPAYQNALQADNDDLGGYIKTPQRFIAELLKDIDNAVFVRRYARIIQITETDSLGVPSLDSDMDDADWTTELATGNEDTGLGFGKRELKAQPLAKRVKVSRKLLRIGALSPEQIVRERMAYKFGISMEKAYLTGDGNGKPLGVFVASPNGITTARDVSTGNTATEITFDGLKEAKYSLKQGYWPGARWLFHRDAVKMLAKIKDNDGQYIWQQSVAAGEPDRLLNFPVDMSEYAPNTFTAGQYVGILANWQMGYWILDSLTMEIQRLVELYAEQNQIGFIGRYEGDGMPVLQEAFVRVKLGA